MERQPKTGEEVSPVSKEESKEQKKPFWSTENIYDHIPLTVKQLDIIIYGGIALIVLILVYGVLQAKGIL